MKKSRKKKNAKKVSITIAILLITISIPTFGIYVLNKINDFYLRSNEFYFYSDKLKDTEAIYQINNWSGVDPYTITINMNSMYNNLKKTSYDISYDISYSCTDNATCQISKSSGVILANSNSDFFNIIITPNVGLRTGDKVTVAVTATSISKYKKNLKARFTLVVGQESLSYEIVDSKNSKYLDLNITNTLSYYNIKEAFGSYKVGDKIDVDTYLSLSDTDKSKCYSAIIILKFNPNVVLLDMTNTNYLNSTSSTTTQINNSNYINSITFKVEPISSAVIRFYKQDVTKDYTYPIINSKSIIEVTTES